MQASGPKVSEGKNVTMWLIFVISALLLGLSFSCFPPHDPDLGWHLLGGEWILRHGAVPIEDPINAFNTSWVDYHWLGQIIIAGIYNAGGYPLLQLALGILMAVLALVLLDTIKVVLPKSHTALVVATTLLLSLLLIGTVTSIRPQMISLFGVALALRVIVVPPKKIQFPLLFLITALLANIHIYWIFVPVLWFFYRVLPRAEKSAAAFSPFAAWGGLLILFLAGGLSPYGFLGDGSRLPFGIFTNHALLLEYVLGSSELAQSINEFKSGLAGDFPMPLLLLASFALCIRFTPLTSFKKNLGSVGLALLTFVLAVKTLKFVGVFGVLGIPLFALSFDDALKTWRNKWPTVEHLSTLALSGVMVFVAVQRASLPLTAESYLKEVPLKACTALASMSLEKSEANSRLRILTHFDYGGWCRWAIYETNPNLDYRVTTDGRTQFVPEEHYQKSFDLYRLNYGWAETLAAWNPDVVLVEKVRALGQFMIRAPQFWRVVYEDDKFALFVPVRSSTTASIK